MDEIREQIHALKLDTRAEFRIVDRRTLDSLIEATEKLLAVYEAAQWVIQDGAQGNDDSALVRYEPLEALDEAVSAVQTK